MSERLSELAKRKEQALHAGSERSVERQHAKGKMLARERIEFLLDPGSFHELDMLARHRAHDSGLNERPYTDGVVRHSSGAPATGSRDRSSALVAYGSWPVAAIRP